MSELTQAQKATNADTYDHINLVQHRMWYAITGLMYRAVTHDQSKLRPPEVDLFAEWGPKLSSVPYGSDEYKEMLEELKPALDHHYSANSHHPEHFENGIEGMTLLGLVEMLSDWYSSTARRKDSDIYKSIEINTERFGISPQLRQILINTIERNELGN